MRASDRDGRLRRHAHPRHARVDLDLDGEPPAPRRRRGRERGDLPRVLHHGHEVEAHRVGRLALSLDPAEHQNGRAHPRVSELGGLADADDRQPRDARRLERGADGARAVTVGVGLDHADQLAAGGEAAELGEVVRERGEVDVGRPARARGSALRRDAHFRDHRSPRSSPPRRLA